MTHVDDENLGRKFEWVSDVLMRYVSSWYYTSAERQV